MFRKGWIGILLTLVLLFHSSWGQAQTYTPKAGETLRYKLVVKSVIHGADQTVKVVGRETYRNQDVFRIRAQMNSVGIVHKLYSYSETEEALLDADGLYPLWIRRKVHEKDSVETEEVFFDYQRGVAVRLVAENGRPAERSEIKLPGHVYHGFSLQYYLRKKAEDPRPGKLYFYSNGKIKEVTYRAASGHREPLTLESGTYSDYIQLVSDDITVVIAANDEKYPLIIRKMAKFGKVEARLVSIAP